MSRFTSTSTSFLGALLVAGLLAIGGCAGGNVTGPQPDSPDEDVVTQDDGGNLGGAVTNGDGDGTAGQADHNSSTED